MAPRIFFSLCVWMICTVPVFAQPMNRQVIPPDVTVEKDVVYSTVNGKNLLMDLMYPKEKNLAPRPVVVWIHGGAWLEGNKDINPAFFLTKSGYFTASINYRLSPEALWPAQIHDCKAAIRFLRAHAEEYNLDPDKIGVWGASAGGHLVAMLGASGDVEELEGEGGWTDFSSRVQAVADFFGPTDLIKICDFPSEVDHAAADAPEAKLLGGSVKENPEKVKSANPITYVSSDDPPFLIAHGDKDMTVPYNQSELLRDALKKAHVDVEFITVKGGGHGGWNDSTQPTNQEVREKVKAFFDRVLKK